MAAGLAIALAVSVAFGLTTEKRLRAELAAAQIHNASASKSLAVCEATNLTLTNALAVIETGDEAQAAPTAALTPEQLLARRAAGADACARAFEAEALVREAAQ